jgi:cytochrome c peroxidase
MRYLGLLFTFVVGVTFANEPITPIKASSKELTAKQRLGKTLFHEKGLSKDGSVSCASCHDLNTGGVDGLITSIGINSQKGPINSPTVYNSSLNFVQFWDGRAKDLKEQAAGPVTNPLEMGADWNDVIVFLKSKPEYVVAFKRHYNGDISKETVTDAIAVFEETLVTPSPFDAYLLGDENAISNDAKRGYRLFKSYGCTACHNGPNVGGGLFMKMGLASDYFKGRGGELTEADLGRYNVTKQEADKHVFKVPTLRNIALTAPYFHDGSVDSLSKAVKIMGKVQLNRDIPPQDVAAIVAFLESLTGNDLKKDGA